MMLRIFAIIAVISGAVFSSISLLSAIYSNEPIAYIVTVVAFACFAASIFFIRQTKPVGKILPGSEPAKVQRFKQLRRLRGRHYRAPLIIAGTWMAIHVFLVFTERLSLSSNTAEFYALGAGLGRSFAHGEYSRLITGFFIHQSTWQMICNVVGLLTVGRLLDFVLGWRNFLAITVLGTAAGALIACIVAPNVVMSYAAGAPFVVYGGLIAALMFSNKLKRVDIPDSIFMGAAIQIFGAVNLGQQQFGENLSFLAASLVFGFSLCFMWFLLEKDKLVRSLSLVATGLFLVMFCFSALGKMVPMPTISSMAFIHQATPSRAPASTVQSVENNVWDQFISMQNKLGQSRWVQKAVLPTFDLLVEQAQKARMTFVKKKFSEGRSHVATLVSN
jgi:membrane associated rhomboid family serine protease